MISILLALNVTTLAFLTFFLSFVQSFDSETMENKGGLTLLPGLTGVVCLLNFLSFVDQLT
jgi:hypothetical protein